MGQSDNLLVRFGAEPSIVSKPALLLLAPFLASVPYVMPNARILRDVFGVEGLELTLVVSFSIAAAVLSIAAVAASNANRLRNGFGKTSGRVASAAYIVLLIALYAVLVGAPNMPPNMLAVSGISACSAIALAPVIFRWVSLYKMDMRNIMFYGALSCTGAAVIAWMLSWLPPLGLAIGSVVCAAAGCLPLFLPANVSEEPEQPTMQIDGMQVRDEAAGSEKNALGDFLPILWAPYLGMLVCVYISCATEFATVDFTLHSEFIGAITASIVAIIACLVVRNTPLTMAVEFIVTPVLIGLAVVFGSFQPGDLPFFIGAALVFAPLMFMTLYALSLLESVIAAGDFSMPFVIGATFAATSLASLLGAATNAFLPTSVFTPYTWVIACAYFAIALVHIGLVAWRSITRAKAGKLAEEDAESGDQAGKSPQHATDLELEWQARVDKLADEHGLTARERELLDYMSRGYGSVYISKVLFISDNTARTHIRNIYRKLGVHSREELIALFL